MQRQTAEVSYRRTMRWLELRRDPDRPGARHLGAVALITLVAGTGAATVACAEDGAPSDELYDFVEPETSEPLGGTPYDTYVMLVERQGVAFLPFQEAELRALELCDAPDSAATSGDTMVSDVALLRAYCPEVESERG